MTKRIVIVGGGISGLSLAYFLEKHAVDAEITLLEKQSRLGGWCHSETVQDFLFEKGPRCFKATKAVSLLSLVEEVDLLGKVIFSSKEAEKRYLYYQNKLHKLPQGFFSFLFSPLTRKTLFPLIKDALFPQAFYPDQTIYDFVYSRLGKHAAEILFDSFVLGIYASDSKKLSMKECFPELYNLMQKRGSFLSSLYALQKKQKLSRQLSYIGLMGFKGGISTFIQGIEKSLKKTRVRLDAECYELTVKENKEVEIFTSQGVFLADQVFIALPKQKAQDLLLPFAESVFSPLQEIECVSVASVNLGFHQKVFEKKAFGYLIPSCYGEPNIGTLFESEVFPQKMGDNKGSCLGVMMGGAHHPEIETYSENKLVQLAREKIKKFLHIEAVPDAVSVTLAKKALPSFSLSHRETIEKIQKNILQSFPQIELVGNYLEGVSVNDCIAYSQKVANQFCAKEKIEKLLLMKRKSLKP